jgi:heptosyltransferase-1
LRVRVLITRLSAFGDIVHAWPLAVALRRAPQPATVAWVVEEPFLPLVAGHPDVAVAIPVATRRWRRAPLAEPTRTGIRAAREAIAAFAADVALDPQGLVKSALWPAVAGVPRRVGLAGSHRRELAAGAFYTETVVPGAERRHVVDATLALLTPLGMPADCGAVPDGRFLLGGNTGGARDEAAVALLPAAGRSGKCWPTERFGELAQRLAASGRRPLVVVGPGEDALAREVLAASRGAAEPSPPTTIPELAHLLAGCAAAVGGDTGPVHLAAALGTATVAIFLTSDAARNGPRGARVNVVTGAGSGASRGRARTSRVGEVTVGEVETALAALVG